MANSSLNDLDSDENITKLSFFCNLIKNEGPFVLLISDVSIETKASKSMNFEGFSLLVYVIKRLN